METLPGGLERPVYTGVTRGAFGNLCNSLHLVHRGTLSYWLLHSSSWYLLYSLWWCFAKSQYAFSPDAVALEGSRQTESRASVASAERSCYVGALTGQRFEDGLQCFTVRGRSFRIEHLAASVSKKEFAGMPVCHPPSEAWVPGCPAAGHMPGYPAAEDHPSSRRRATGTCCVQPVPRAVRVSRCCFGARLLGLQFVLETIYTFRPTNKAPRVCYSQSHQLS